MRILFVQPRYFPICAKVKISGHTKSLVRRIYQGVRFKEMANDRRTTTPAVPLLEKRFND